MIDQFASSAAIAVLNRMLVREQWARDKLAPFAGRSARFDAAPFTLTLQVADGGVFAAANPSEPAVIIGIALSSLPLAMLDPKAAMKDVRLSGDAEFAQALAFVKKSYRVLLAMRRRSAWSGSCARVLRSGSKSPTTCSIALPTTS